MTPSRRRKHSLARTVFHSDDLDGMLAYGLLAVIGAIALTVSAKVQIPFWPVPATAQTLVVLLIGVVFGPRLGVATVAVYLAEGAAGWPVFAAGGGIDYFLGPSGGYLVGFVAAAGVVGYLAERGYDRKWHTALLVFLIGDAVLFAFGLAWLTYLSGFSKALAVGLTPFLPAEALKIAIAVAALPLAWKHVGRWY